MPFNDVDLTWKTVFMRHLPIPLSGAMSLETKRRIDSQMRAVEEGLFLLLRPVRIGAKPHRYCHTHHAR